MTQPEAKPTSDDAFTSKEEMTSPLTVDEDDGSTLTDGSAAAAESHDSQMMELKDQLMRALAETENVRKRAQRDVEEANKYATTSFARGLINVLENLQRALATVSPEVREQNDQLRNLMEGVEMTQRELLSVFEKHGIRRVEPMGEKFDHNLHQAMSQIEDANAEPGTVLQVFQAGYVIHDRLLQPALVAVSKRGEPQSHVDTKA